MLYVPIKFRQPLVGPLGDADSGEFYISANNYGSDFGIPDNWGQVLFSNVYPVGTVVAATITLSEIRSANEDTATDLILFEGTPGWEEYESTSA